MDKNITKKEYERLSLKFYCNPLQEFIEDNQTFLYNLFKKEFDAYKEAYYAIERKISNLFEPDDYDVFKEKLISNNK